MASYFGGFFLTIKLNAVNFLALFQKLGKIAKTFLCLFNQNESSQLIQIQEPSLNCAIPQTLASHLFE